MWPEALYKYVVPARIDVLLSRKIRFTQGCFLNDPFEFRPGMPIADAGGLGRFEAKRALNGAAFFREKARLYGVLSLTEKSDSIPMWTHYAAAHTGFVIAFDTASEAFRTALEEKKLCQVQYQDKRPDLARYPTTIFWTKSRDWEYEQEWRWLESDDPSEYADVVAAPNGELLYLRSIPPQIRLPSMFGTS